MTEQEARRRVISAMCPDRVCQTCGEPSRRIVGEATYPRSSNPNTHGDNRSKEPGKYMSGQPDGKHASSYKPVQGLIRVAPTLGFTDCGHDDWRPGVWIDPFAAAGEK